MSQEEPHHDRGMSGTETMMWRIERDPWLAPSGGSLTLFDRPLDAVWFGRSMARAVSTIARLRQHMVASSGDPRLASVGVRPRLRARLARAPHRGAG